MLIEAVGFVLIIGGLFAFAAVCAWSAQTLKQETGGIVNPSIFAGAFVFYHLVVKVCNGDAALHNYIIGLAALAVIAVDAFSVREQYGNRVALARALSSVYGALALAMLAMFLFGGGGKKHDDKK